MMSHLRVLCLATLAACGSKSPSPTTDKPSGSAVAAVTLEPTPVEPAKPVEPLGPDPEKVKADLFAAETTAYDKAKPAFDRHCARCHTKSGNKASGKKLGHFDMTTYPFGGEHAKSIGNEIRVVLAIDGSKKASMPDDKPGSLKGDDLTAIKTWSEAWQAAGQAGVHPADPADKDDD